MTVSVDARPEAEPRAVASRESARVKPRRSRRRSTAAIVAMQVLVLIAILAAWQWLPSIHALRNFSVAFDPFFISSPDRVYHRVSDLLTGAGSTPAVWPNLWVTLKATLIGVAIGTVTGAIAGLVLSNNDTLERVANPFVAFFNSMPRVALVPIFVIIAGPTATASALVAVVVVFFLVFYNAFAGGSSVPIQTVQNAQLLGASPSEVMRQVRLPYVMVWTFTALPNALSFGLVAVVTAEILTGQIGMGALLAQSINTVDSTLTFSVVVILSLVGVLLVTLADLVKARALHWWESS
jgi:NitT/TauT family transport system permease protein